MVGKIITIIAKTNIEIFFIFPCCYDVIRKMEMNAFIDIYQKMDPFMVKQPLF